MLRRLSSQCSYAVARRCSAPMVLGINAAVQCRTLKTPDMNPPNAAVGEPPGWKKENKNASEAAADALRIKFEAERDALESRLEKLQTEEKPDNDQIFSAMNSLAAVFRRYRQFPEEVRILSQMVPQLKQIFGMYDEKTLLTSTRLAIARGDCGDLKSQIRELEDLLPALIKCFGTTHKNTVIALRALASANGRFDNYDRQVELLTQLLEIEGKDLTAAHATKEMKDAVGLLVTEKGTALGNLNREEEKKDFLEHWVPKLKMALGEEHPVYLMNVVALATGCGKHIEPARVVDLLQSVMPQLNATIGPRHVNTVNVRRRHALAVGRLGNQDEELELLKATLADCELGLGHHHPEAYMTLHCLSDCQRRTGRFADRVESLRQLANRMETYLGMDHLSTHQIQQELAEAKKMVN